MDKKFVHVEILCISICKTLFILLAKLCAFLHHSHSLCAKSTFPTKFSYVSHQVFHSLFTPVYKESFPLFHTPYYYYYELNKLLLI